MCIGSPKQISSDDIINTWLLDPYECEIPIYCALCLSSDIGYVVTNAWNGVEHQSLCLCVGACLFVAIESCETERDCELSRVREWQNQCFQIVKSNEWHEKRLCALWLNIELAPLVTRASQASKEQKAKRRNAFDSFALPATPWSGSVYICPLTHI